MKQDKYDEAIKYFKSMIGTNMRVIEDAWNMPTEDVNGSCLFQFVHPDGYKIGRCGCLTQVKSGYEEAYTPELTEAIRADERIPDHVPMRYEYNDEKEHKKDVLKFMKSFPVLAEWQRKIDKELGRK